MCRTTHNRLQHRASQKKRQQKQNSQGNIHENPGSVVCLCINDPSSTSNVDWKNIGWQASVTYKDSTNIEQTVAVPGVIVTVQAQHLPVAAIFRVIGVVVIDVVHRQLAQIGVDKLP